MSQPPYDEAPNLSKSIGEVGPSWREPVDEDEPPFADAAERGSGLQAQPSSPAGERYWTEGRIMRLGATVAFVIVSVIFTVKVSTALPSVAWLPYLILTIAYGALAYRFWSAHFEAEEAARQRADRAANSRLRMNGQ